MKIYFRQNYNFSSIKDTLDLLKIHYSICNIYIRDSIEHKIIDEIKFLNKFYNEEIFDANKLIVLCNKYTIIYNSLIINLSSLKELNNKISRVEKMKAFQ